ncbi:GNAT family N-acetyltransferase, partial [Propionicimonas sp.]|uniref:GNAT family N-acetyltransferase n=1 Tax=Propionicimonas sp. TaxID=1955623 RepID=UPI0039E64EE0
TVDGRFAGEAHYTVRDGVAAFDHTMVPSEFGGRGVAGRLVQHAMDEVRAAGEWKVRPVCSYVGFWFDRHPEYADLLA